MIVDVSELDDDAISLVLKSYQETFKVVIFNRTTMCIYAYYRKK
jgi:hypothetical protein